MGECSVYSSLQWTHLQPGLQVGGHLALTHFCPNDPKWTLIYSWCRRW